VSAFPYLYCGFLLFGGISLVWHLANALRTGHVDERIWFGADKDDDHYGYVIRILGLIFGLGVLGYMATNVPDIFAFFEEIR
jgi:hypothetical protein